MFPYRDENETRRTPYITIALVAACGCVWILLQHGGLGIALPETVCDLGLIPGELTGLATPGGGFPMGDGLVCVTDPGRQFSHIFTSMFLHGSWMHLLGNMWFLWLFGNNIEDSMTRPRFLIFYLLCGLAAALTQVLAQPSSPVPMVGASGAISGVMGAYLVLFPRVRVFTLVTLGFFITSIAVPAWVMLIYWALLQLASGLMPAAGQGGVAVWAHVGGFVAGVLLIRFFAVSDRIAFHQARQWQPRRMGW